MRFPTKTEYALAHLQELQDDLADRHSETPKIPRHSFAIAAEFLTALGESTISAIGEPNISPGDNGDLRLDWEPPKTEIHVVVVDHMIYGDAYLRTGIQHAENLTEVINLVSLAASSAAN